MIDYVIMLMILVFMGIELLWGAKYLPKNKSFFSEKNTRALRGFWIIWVILVHAPEVYQNKIQDMVGSFGYIAITFFFMTSAYGLTLTQNKNPDSIRLFWRKRLPKLLVVSWMANIIGSIANYVFLGKNISIIEILRLSGWIKWLLACYFAFWISNVALKRMGNWKILCSVLIVVGSLIMYYLKNVHAITSTTWHTECYGFIWGIVLASVGASDFANYFSRKWRIKWIISIIISIVLGCMYLMFKPVLFWGDYLLKVVLGVAITFVVIIANTKIDFGNKISLFMGSLTFEIYLLHGYVIDVLNGIHKWEIGGIYTVSCIVLTIIASVVLHYVANIIMKRVKEASLFVTERPK